MSNKIEKELTKEGSKSLKNIKSKAKKAKAAEQVKQSNHKTEEAKSSTPGGIKLFRSKSNNVSIPTNPNSRERKKKVSEDGHGRMKGQKNLVKLKNGSGQVYEIINQHGVSFSPQDEKDLRSLVDGFYRKRANLAKNEMGLLLGYDKDGNLSQTKDRILTIEFSKGLQQFKSYDEFESYKAEIKRYNSRSYLTDLTNEYKDKLLKTIANTTDMSDKEFDEIKKKISKMSQKEFAVRFGIGFFGTLSLYYDRHDKTGERSKRLEDMSMEELKTHEARQAISETERGGSASNIDDVKRRLGIGEDALGIEDEMAKFRKYREDRKRKEERRKEKKLQKEQAEEAKFQEFLKQFNQEDNEQTRAMFKHLRS